MADSSKFHLHHGASGAAIAVHVIPGSVQNQIADISADGTVTVQVKAPDCGESSNPALIKYLAEILKVPAASIEIVAGKAGPDKLVTVLNVDSGKLQERILKIAGR